MRARALPAADPPHESVVPQAYTHTHIVTNATTITSGLDALADRWQSEQDNKPDSAPGTHYFMIKLRSASEIARSVVHELVPVPGGVLGELSHLLQSGPPVIAVVSAWGSGYMHGVVSITAVASLDDVPAEAKAGLHGRWGLAKCTWHRTCALSNAQLTQLRNPSANELPVGITPNWGKIPPRLGKALVQAAFEAPAVRVARGAASSHWEGDVPHGNEPLHGDKSGMLAAPSMPLPPPPMGAMPPGGFPAPPHGMSGMPPPPGSLPPPPGSLPPPPGSLPPPPTGRAGAAAAKPPMPPPPPGAAPPAGAARHDAHIPDNLSPKETAQRILDIWLSGGRGYLVHTGPDVYAETVQKKLLGWGEPDARALAGIHPGAPVLLLDIGSGQLHGLLRAAGSVGEHERGALRSRLPGCEAGAPYQLRIVPSCPCPGAPPAKWEAAFGLAAGSPPPRPGELPRQVLEKVGMLLLRGVQPAHMLSALRALVAPAPAPGGRRSGSPGIRASSHDRQSQRTRSRSRDRAGGRRAPRRDDRSPPRGARPSRSPPRGRRGGGGGGGGGRRRR